MKKPTAKLVLYTFCGFIIAALLLQTDRHTLGFFDALLGMMTFLFSWVGIFAKLFGTILLMTGLVFVPVFLCFFFKSREEFYRQAIANLERLSQEQLRLVTQIESQAASTSALESCDTTQSSEVVSRLKSLEETARRRDAQLEEVCAQVKKTNLLVFETRHLFAGRTTCALDSSAADGSVCTLPDQITEVDHIFCDESGCRLE